LAIGKLDQQTDEEELHAPEHEGLTGSSSSPSVGCSAIVERRVGKWGDLNLTGQKALEIPSMYHACVLRVAKVS
jgi:hypothetical protein